MSTIHMLIGIPGSGKSHYSVGCCKRERAMLVASDAIREKLFGSEHRQKNTYRVFDEAFTEIDHALASGRNVVFDATNVARDRRMQFFKRYRDVPVEGHVCVTPYEIAKERVLARKRRIEDKVLQKYLKNFEFPVLAEGFERLHIVHTPAEVRLGRIELEQLLALKPEHDELFAYLRESPFFNVMLGYDQENPFHSKSLSEHTYAVLEYVNAFYEGEHLLAMQLAALFHDAGKPLCKVWKPNRGYYSYFGHEHVSAGIACHVLKQLGYDDDFILHVVNLVSFHMEILHGGDAGASRIYHLLGDRMLAELYFFSEADTFAK
ncbi:AAA family ATPase [Paenibacillus sp. HN-1]|uniref:AAA family ATPase n=1 Tax=Paenibacillus TaxID=44249 RepID=UPI001CA7DE0D|nr:MULTISPECIES: AAA family ATPase [Paenibacillus]MBY9078161.1 AAA family ATPase [Paenibacillus sp. CGMCC 1.18879]MBY9083902.1 AAA family ATPase [Paenibacillus sinensis]